MKEKLVNFETAKLAKQKGFDWVCTEVFSPEGKINPFDDLQDIWKGYNSLEDYLEVSNSKLNKGYISAPSMSLLQDWLREEHDVDIYVVPNGMRKRSINPRLYHPNIWYKSEYQSELDSRYSYHEALEYAIVTVLNLI